jgi:hypothetical protein
MCLHYKEKPLILLREIIAVYFENHTKHTNTLCLQNEEICNVKSGDTYEYSNHCAVNSYVIFGGAGIAQSV